MEIQVYHTLPEAARQIRQEVFVEEQHFPHIWMKKKLL